MHIRLVRSRLVLLALLTATALPGCRSDDPAKLEPPKPAAATSPRARAQAMADITVLKDALDAFAKNNAGQYPESLAILVAPDRNGHRYLNVATVPLDPWHREYVYAREPMCLVTYGRDGRPGGEGEDADIDYASIVHGH